jgi:hypothetical protein
MKSEDQEDLVILKQLLSLIGNVVGCVLPDVISRMSFSFKMLKKTLMVRMTIKAHSLCSPKTNAVMPRM